MRYNFILEFFKSKRYSSYLFKHLLYCFCIILGFSQTQAQNTPLIPAGSVGTTLANGEIPCAAGSDVRSFDFTEDGDSPFAGPPNTFFGDATAVNGFNSLGLSWEFEPTGGQVINTSTGVRTNTGQNETSIMTISFDQPMVNPIIEFTGLQGNSTIELFDCSGAPLSPVLIAETGSHSLTGNTLIQTSGATGASAALQLPGSVDCFFYETTAGSGIGSAGEGVTLEIRSCVTEEVLPPCTACGPNESFEYITLANASGSGTGATADVLLDGVLYGDAEVLFSDLDVNEDLSGAAFGAFDNDGGVFLLQVNLCAPITVQQLDILGLETESQVSVGNGLTGAGSTGMPTGLPLTQCGGSPTMVPIGNMVTNTNTNCRNQSNGNYTVGGATVNTLYFRYTNPTGGCTFDKATFRIGVCNADPGDIVPTCPLTEVTLTDDPDGFAAAIAGGGTGAAFTFTVTQDANGNYFNQNCGQIENEVNNGTPVPIAVISPCAEVVDENLCGFCTPIPPCVTCSADESYEFLTLSNASGSGTGTTADVSLNGVIYGEAEVLFSNLTINEDLSGSSFGAFANGRTMEETLVLQVTLCEPITVQQVDIIGLETESQVWVGTGLSGAGNMAIPTGLTLTQCGGDANMVETGNMVTNNAGSCSNQGDGNYTVGAPTVNVLFFRYTNPVGGCSFDKATFRIGTCVPELPEAVPTCPLALFEVTEQDGVTTSSVYRDANGLYFNTSVCTDPLDMMTPVQSIAISPCATTMVIGECEFCCSFDVTCPTDLDLGTFDCNTLANIPAMPMVMTTAAGDITVDNAAGDYQIEVGDTPCGTIIVNTTDDIMTPDVCSTGGQTITRTVTIFDDENGNGVFDPADEETPITCNFTITITEDTTPAVITCPADVTIECDADTSPASNGMATAMDNCSSEAEITITFMDSSTQGTTGCAQFDFVITRTWMATDACGNTSTCNQIITVEDSTPAVITCPADVTIECNTDTSPASNGMATTVDNCATAAETTVTFSDVSTQTASGCGQFDFVITRTWLSSDPCGNTSSCVQIITVEDSTPPVITCPADQMLVCDTDPLPIANTINDFIAIGGTTSDNCSSLMELSISISDFPSAQSMLNFCPGTPVEDRTLTRTYTITDICGNESTCQQQFIYAINNVGPVITSIPLDQTVDCQVNAFPQLGLFMAEGTCSDISFSVSGPMTNGTAGCPGSTIQYMYTATDVCGRSASHVQTYTLANEGPEFICPVGFCIIECPADLEERQQIFDDYASVATVISSCAESTVSISNNFNPNGFINQNCQNPFIAVDNATAFQIVTFTAVDNCGRSATCTSVAVIIDNAGPEITGNVISGSADCSDANLQEGYTIWANAQINSLSATDGGCSNGPISFSFAPSTPDVNCPGGSAVTEVTFTATDGCGNETIMTTYYVVIDGGAGEPVMANVSGTLMTEESETIELAEVDVDGFINNMMTTSADGYYEFDLLTAQNYAISPSRNDNPLNGITTFDLILLGQHLLEINSLDSPYKMIAADVNESGSITALDMIQLRRLILFIDDEFSAGKSWTFVDADYVFPQPTNPFATTYPTVYNINNLTTTEIVDFIGVKLGDLNASASATLLQSGDTRSSDGTLNIKLEDELLKAGQTYDLAFNASDFKEVAGFQFTLDFAADYLEVLDYESSELSAMTENNFGFTKANEGKVTVSWNETTAVDMADDATLFTMSFTALKDVQLSEVLTINSSVTASEAYQADLRKDVTLDFGKTIANGNGFALLQNQPNPFGQETLIGFQLPEATEATLTIFDVSGRVVYTTKNTYDAGVHQVMLDKAELGATGVLYYQLSTPKFTDTKKMIVLK